MISAINEILTFFRFLGDITVTVVTCYHSVVCVYVCRPSHWCMLILVVPSNVLERGLGLHTGDWGQNPSLQQYCLLPNDWPM